MGPVFCPLVSDSSFSVPEFARYPTSQTARVEVALERLLPSAAMPPATLHATIRHSMFAGGKRLRPVLLLDACEACGRRFRSCPPRRLPTCHKAYGDAIAVLAGGALQPMAFELLLQRRPVTDLKDIHPPTRTASA